MARLYRTMTGRQCQKQNCPYPTKPFHRGKIKNFYAIVKPLSRYPVSRKRKASSPSPSKRHQDDKPFRQESENDRVCLGALRRRLDQIGGEHIRIENLTVKENALDRRETLLAHLLKSTPRWDFTR